jgi:S1-C subfamily serine protease
MTPHFVGKTSLVGLKPLWVGDRPALTQFVHLSSLLEARLGREAATLFAEPLVTPATGDSPGSVSWYAASGGQPEPLPLLSADRRERAEAKLRGLLANLAPLMEDPELGALLRAALVIASPDHILSLDGGILLIGWGLGPAEESVDGFAGDLPPPLVLAPYMPDTQPTPVYREPVRSVPASLRASDPLPPPPLPPQNLGHESAMPRAVPPPRSMAGAGRLIPGALLVALVFLAFGLWLGSVVVERSLAAHPQLASIANPEDLRAAIARQSQENAELEQDIEVRQRALQGNACAINPETVPSIGPNRTAPVPRAAVPPPPGARQFQGSLASLLDQAVVLVISPVHNGIETGSGFFVTPNLILTNRHVVANSDPKRIWVTNQKLGGTHHVTLVAETPSDRIGGPDFALLRIDGVSGIQPLSLTKTAQPLDEVIAAGYPGLLVEEDPSFSRLLNGDSKAIPEIILTDGRIDAIQTTSQGIQIMPHSAAVSGGNSGGPLVDVCGRVVGVNTFITADRDQVAHANYAQKADGVIAFLEHNGVKATVVDGPCPTAEPTPAAVPVPPAAPSNGGVQPPAQTKK